MSFELRSSAFKPNRAIPKKFTCDGSDVSPPLNWNDPPQGTKSLCLIADDPDAPRGTWVHWVLYDLPPDVRELAEAVPPLDKLDSTLPFLFLALRPFELPRCAAGYALVVAGLRR